MGITVEVGRTYSNTTTEKPRFTKEMPRLTEAVEIEDSLTLQSPDPEFQPSRYSQFDAGTRAIYRDTVKELATAGRLYVKEPNGLRRADPMEIKERFDHSKPIEVVSRVASQVDSSGSHQSSASSKQRGIFTEGYNLSSSSDNRSRTERVFYGSSTISEWDSLEFASSGQGVQGVALLPASGGSVVVNDSYESNWASNASRQWGVFTEKNTSENNGGYTRVNRTAD